MGLPVTVYRYTDAGAPQLVNCKPSEWINILKKVLVEGYGSKQPLGWTVEFENAGAFKIAFRNKIADGGSGGYVQFYSQTGADTSFGMIAMKCAMGMSALDTFIKPMHVRVLQTSVSFKGWEIIGTSRGFYIMVHDSTKTTMSIGSDTAGRQVYFIGDIESFIPNDAAPFTLVNGTNGDSDVVSTSSIGLNIAQNNYCHMYGTDGSNDKMLHIFDKQFYKSLSSNDGNADLLNMPLIMSPLVITTSNSTNANNANNGSVALPYARGRVPGFHTSSFAGYKGETWPYEITQDGIQWVLLRSYYPCQFWIRLGEWYV